MEAVGVPYDVENRKILSSRYAERFSPCETSLVFRNSEFKQKQFFFSSIEVSLVPNVFCQIVFVTLTSFDEKQTNRLSKETKRKKKRDVVTLSVESIKYLDCFPSDVSKSFHLSTEHKERRRYRAELSKTRSKSLHTHDISFVNSSYQQTISRRRIN